VINFVNNGVEDTICFHTSYRTGTALINELGYVAWQTSFVLFGEISEGVASRGLEIHNILDDYFAAKVFS
jgi:hypothetical protein